MLVVMLERDHFAISCYKIMSFLAIVDILSIIINCPITGFLAYQGAVYCTYPNLIYISGMAAMGLWCCSCVVALILVMNRLLDLIFPNLGQFLFNGNRTFYVLILSILYGLYFVFFNTPICFTSKYHSWFFDPMIFKGKSIEYANVPHFFNNVFVVAITCCLYLIFCVAVGAKLKNVDHTLSGARKASTQVFFQSAMICGVNLLASIIYVTMNYIEVPFWLIMVGQHMWQLGNCAPALIYLKFNRTIRNGVMRKLGVKVCSTSLNTVCKCFIEGSSRKSYTDQLQHFTVTG
uniref:Serpentine Receptor, class T n=3 Tax=Caenorhabditis tropicalis TaxID=1561998 RepID=A0A1I7V2Z0_9PELO